MSVIGEKFGFMVEGPILGWMRPAGARGHRYDPDEQVKYKTMLAWYCKIAMKKKGLVAPLTGPLALGVYAYFPYPGTGKKIFTHKTTKPDLDNIIKNVKDALNKVAWQDDSQVARYMDPFKVYSPEAGKSGYMLVEIARITDAK